MTKKTVGILVGILICIICIAGYRLFEVDIPENCEAYKQEPKVNNIEFNKFDKAKKIIIVPQAELDLVPIIITEPEKINLAQETIRRYPDGWVEFHYTKWNLLEVTAAPPVEFYDADDHLLDYYRIRRDILVYRTNDKTYWRCIGVEELQPLIDALGIPREVLSYP